MLYGYQYFYITRTLIEMFYSGGARKKNAIREMLKFQPEKIEEDVSSSSDSRSNSRSNSRSKSRSNSRSKSRNNSDNESSDSDEERESSVYKPNSRTTANHSDTDNVDRDGDGDGDDDLANPDQNDYIVTLSSNDASGQHYHYAFIEEELEYELEEFVETHPEIKTFQMVIYKMNTGSSLPFLEFLFYYDKSEHANCHLPYYHHKPKHHIRKETDGIMNKLFTGKYRYKGFFHDTITDECFIFYEKYFVHEPTNDKTVFQQLQKPNHYNHWFWVCTPEIIYHRKYVTLPIDDNVVDFFIAYPTVGILQATFASSEGKHRFQKVNIEAPAILYYGSELCYAKNTAIYGMKREPIISRYGPFYYFTTFEHSFYWACYVKSRDGKTKRRESSNGGISRYAVFTKKTKTAFIDDDYDVDVVEKYRERKNIFETKTPHFQQGQEDYHSNKMFDSVYSYDYDWTIDYDTIYNGYYNVNKKDTLRPVWSIHDHHNFQLLSYYEVDVGKCPEQYDPSFLDYKVM